MDDKNDDNKIGLKDRLSQMIHTARSATPGPWTHCGQDRGGCQCGLVWSLAIDDTVASTNVTRDDPEEHVPVEMVKANASHIATFSPDVAAALVAVVDAAADQNNCPFCGLSGGDHGEPFVCPLARLAAVLGVSR